VLRQLGVAALGRRPGRGSDGAGRPGRSRGSSSGFPARTRPASRLTAATSGNGHPPRCPHPPQDATRARPHPAATPGRGRARRAAPAGDAAGTFLDCPASSPAAAPTHGFVYVDNDRCNSGCSHERLVECGLSRRVRPVPRDVQTTREGGRGDDQRFEPTCQAGILRRADARSLRSAQARLNFSSEHQSRNGNTPTNNSLSWLASVSVRIQSK